jgi:hypothetical protein
MRVYFRGSALHRDTYPRNEMQPCDEPLLMLQQLYL